MRARGGVVCALMLLAAGAVAADGWTHTRSHTWVRWVDTRESLAAHRRAPGKNSSQPPVRAAANDTAWTRNGIPVCSVASSQGEPRVVSDNNGGAVVTWIDSRRSHNDIYAERLDGKGNPLWPAAGVVLAANDSDLVQPLPMPDGSGGAFVVIGQSTLDGFSDVLVQHVTSTGAIASGWSANGMSVAPGGATGYGAVPTGDGFLNMGWVDLNGQLRLVRLTASGGYASGWTAAGLAVGRAQNNGQVGGAPDGAGGAYICWAESDSVMLTRVAAGGGLASGWAAAGTVVHSDPFFSFAQDGVAAALLTGGDVMVFWSDLRNFTLDIFAMRYTSGGLPAAGWPATGAQAISGVTTGPLVSPAAVPDGAGGALVACAAGSSDSMLVQRMAGSGAPSSGWPVEGVIVSNANRFTSSLISDGASGAIVAWSATKSTMEDGIFAERIGSGGAIVGTWPDGPSAVSDTTSYQSFPDIATDGSHGTIAVWEDYRGFTTRIYAARVLSDGTVGTLAAPVSATAEPGVVRLHWYGPDGALEAGLERASGDGAFAEIARVRSEAGHIRYEDREVVAGQTYRYRLAVQQGGATSYLGAVTLRVPEGLRLALAGFAPNPAIGALRLAYALPTGERARIEVLDTAGRRVLARDLDSTPGEHVVSFEDRALGSGVYVLRLTQGSRSVTARAAVVR